MIKFFKLELYKKFFHFLCGSGIGNNTLIVKINKNIWSNLKPEYVEMNNFWVYLDPTDHFGLSVKPYVLPKIYEKITKTGDIIVDVGSNIGIHRMYFSKLVGDEGKVYSFEPEPNNFMLLIKILSLINVKMWSLNRKQSQIELENKIIYIW